MTVLAASKWRDNSELILELVELGYLRKRWLTLDPTYGGGVWWKQWRPASLITHDLEIDGVDFRRLPELDGTFDAITFDPPYVSVGGRKTSTIPDFNKRYGLVGAPHTPMLLQAMINEGMAECVRVLKRRERGKDNGLLLVKCCRYISSGHLWNGTYETEKFAIEHLGLRLIDEFTHIGDPRPQPPRTRKHAACKGQGCADCFEGQVASAQQHARQNSSTLFVFQKAA